MNRSSNQMTRMHIIDLLHQDENAAVGGKMMFSGQIRGSLKRKCDLQKIWNPLWGTVRNIQIVMLPGQMCIWWFMHELFLLEIWPWCDHFSFECWLWCDHFEAGSFFSFFSCTCLEEVLYIPSVWLPWCWLMRCLVDGWTIISGDGCVSTFGQGVG